MTHFELATPEDLATLMEIHTRAFARESVEYGVVLPGSDDLEWHQYNFEHNVYFKIMEDERIVGSVVVVNKGDGEYFLDTLSVDPEFQHRGIGQQAIAFIESHFADAKRWSLHVTPRNVRNQNFYERLGYRRCGTVIYMNPETGETWIPLWDYEKLVEPNTGA
jgi:ribosomal protein S18 acetylase RimI-like enzyme